MRIWFIPSCGIALVAATCVSQVQAAPRPDLPKVAAPPKAQLSQAAPLPQPVFPLHSEAFGVTVQVDEAGFAPLSRISKTLDSSPHFFLKWSTPNRPARASVEFKGFVPQPLPTDIYHTPRPLSYSDRIGGFAIFERVPPYVQTQVAQWEVGDPARTPEDSGAFTKTYDFVTEAPTREKSVLTPEMKITTAHGTQIILKKVESLFDIHLARATFQFIRPNHSGMDDAGADVSLSGGLLDISDDKGQTLKRAVPSEEMIIQLLPTGRDVDYAVENVPSEGAKELHVHLSLREYSTAFRNPARFKMASIEIPVAQLAARNDFKPTAAELTPTTKGQYPGVNTSLDGKFQDGAWNGVLWLQSQEKSSQSEGWTSRTTYSPGTISAKGPDGNALRLTEDYTRYLFGQAGHNDGTLASDDEYAYRVLLDSYGRTMPDTATFSVPLTRFKSRTKPVHFDKIPLPRPGVVADIDAATTGAQDGVRPVKIAVVDEELRTKFETLSRLPIGSVVVVFDRTLPGIGFTPDAVTIDRQKLDAKEVAGSKGDFLAGQRTGSFLSIAFVTSSPLPQTGEFTFAGTLYQNEHTDLETPVEFKDVPIKAPQP